MEDKPRKAKDIDLAEVELLARCREFDYGERDYLIKDLACAVESGSLGRFERLKQRFRKKYGNFNEYEKAGLKRVNENYILGNLKI